MRIGQFVEYKGYVGSIEYDHEDNIYSGKLLNIDNLVNYYADNIFKLEEEYHDAVDDYIEFKKKIKIGYCDRCGEKYEGGAYYTVSIHANDINPSNDGRVSADAACHNLTEATKRLFFTERCYCENCKNKIEKFLRSK